MSLSRVHYKFITSSSEFNRSLAWVYHEFIMSLSWVLRVYHKQTKSRKCENLFVSYKNAITKLQNKNKDS